MDIEVLYEDEYVVVVYKPAGLMVHGDGKSKEETLSDWMAGHYPDSKNVGEPMKLDDGRELLRAGIIHRLDRDTSGVMMLAKTQESFLYLKDLFKNRKVSKIYNTFVYGTIQKGAGVIDRPIGRSNKDFRLRSAQRGARGEMRDAVTEFIVEKYGQNVSYIETRPKTGRTHQLRVHFKAIHHPIVCDPLYAPKKECLLGFTRLALHARSLEFDLPNKTHLVIEAPLPQDFENALKEIEK